LGSCLCFIDSKFNRQIIPAFLIVKIISHGAAFNASTLKLYQDRFQIDIDNCTQFVTSDTTAAACAASNYIDSLKQVDCALHILNLILLYYGIGLRDNVKLQKLVLGDDGIEKKVQVVITGGGPFPDGSRIIQILHSTCKYFGSAQRMTRLQDIQESNHGPRGAPANARQ